jgi:bifunctional DNase/RNase
MIELNLVGVRVELPSNQPIVLLKESNGQRFLPIWIGAVEATAIAFALQGVVTQRPMTHDLLKSVLEEVGVVVDMIYINELREGTFYSSIRLRLNEGTYEVSSRPSDAIALAVRTGVPIYAAEEVVDEAAITIREDEDDEAEETELEEFRKFLEDVSPEDFRAN